MSALSDWELGCQRALHEMRWMARGYVAHLNVFIHEMADEIERDLPTVAGTYSGAVRYITEQVRARQLMVTTRHDNYDITCQQIIERLSTIPLDPLDEEHCTRNDGQLPTSSRGYKENQHA